MRHARPFHIYNMIQFCEDCAHSLPFIALINGKPREGKAHRGMCQSRHNVFEALILCIELV